MPVHQFSFSPRRRLTRKRFRELAGFGALWALTHFTACTFGGLADYDLQECDPRVTTQSRDACEQFNKDAPAGCTPFQCDAVTRHCKQRVRDDDRDGDPSAACGGKDCDDANPQVSSLAVGIPSLIAEANLPRDPAKYSLSVDGGDTALVTFASTTSSGECLSVAKADVGSAVALGACQLLGSSPSLLPTQPSARQVGDAGFAGVFVSVFDCSDGALGFAYGEQLALAPCAKGVARPALSMIDANRALLTWYETPAESRKSPLDNCPTAMAVPLRIGIVESVAAPTITPIALPLALTAKSMQAPAMATRGALTFIASPSDDAVTLWAVDRTAAVIANVKLPSLAKARSAAIAPLTHDDGSLRFAVVADLGCDAQAIHLALVDFVATTKKFTLVADTEVAAGGGGFQWAPSIAWVSARKHWLVSWLSTGQQPRARFIAEDGEADSVAFDVATSALAASALSNGHVSLLSAGATSQQVLDSPARCP